MWRGCSDLGGVGGGAGGGAGCGAESGGGQLCGAGSDGGMRVCGDELQCGSEVYGTDWDVGCERSGGHVRALLHVQPVQPGHLGMEHFERDEHALYVSAALSGGVDAGTRRCSVADSQPGRFREATSFNQDISAWDTSKVTNMIAMSALASAL